ncbi:hypothetical protein [Candidatus Binatus sp.]|uniref:hypothetical protein n=2 Tax=Candidatus Binatus sp. TaxID=2811406 RepID=UPI003CC5A9C1
MLAWLIILWPTAAVADAGVPLVAIFLPLLWLGLIPIIFIEALVNCRLLLIPFRRTLLPATIGNLASAIVGIPLTWVFLWAFEIFFGSLLPPNFMGSTGAKVLSVTIGAPWLGPNENDLWWMIPVALVVFAVPCFAVSVLIEAPINHMGLSDFPRKTIWKVTAKSNILSYLFLGVLTTLALRGDLGHFYPVFGPVVDWFLDIVFRIGKLFVSR